MPPHYSSATQNPSHLSKDHFSFLKPQYHHDAKDLQKNLELISQKQRLQLSLPNKDSRFIISTSHNVSPLFLLRCLPLPTTLLQTDLNPLSSSLPTPKIGLHSPPLRYRKLHPHCCLPLSNIRRLCLFVSLPNGLLILDDRHHSSPPKWLLRCLLYLGLGVASTASPPTFIPALPRSPPEPPPLNFRLLLNLNSSSLICSQPSFSLGIHSFFFPSAGMLHRKILDGVILPSLEIGQRLALLWACFGQVISWELGPLFPPLYSGPVKKLGLSYCGFWAFLLLLLALDYSAAIMSSSAGCIYIAFPNLTCYSSLRSCYDICDCNLSNYCIIRRDIPGLLHLMSMFALL